MPVTPTFARSDPLLDARHHESHPGQEQPPLVTARAMVQMLTGYWLSRAVYTAAKLRVADAVQLLGGGTAVPVDEIARELGLDPSALHRLMRALASAGVFCQEGRHGAWRYGLTHLGEHLLTDSDWSLRHAALMYGEEMAMAWQDMPAVIADEKPAWDRALGASHFGYYQQNPDAALVFDHAMKELGRAMYSDSAIADTYDFTGAVGPYATIVDVGGGLGQLLAAVLQRQTTLRGVLFDRQHVIANAQELHRTEPCSVNLSDRAEYVARMTFKSGDFFESVPDGGDIYVVKRVLHDWDDRSCVDLLAKIRQRMHSSARLLIVEMVIDQGEKDQFSTWLDLNMMMVTGGRERTIEDFSTLLEKADLKLVFVHPTPTLLKVVEAARR
jgi:hypothetical protein